MKKDAITPDSLLVVGGIQVFPLIGGWEVGTQS